MAAQTKTQRQAAAKKAAATRKRNSARQSGGDRQGFRSPDEELRAGHRTRRAHDRQAGRPAQPHVAPRPRRLASGAVAPQAERAC